MKGSSMATDVAIVAILVISIFSLSLLNIHPVIGNNNLSATGNIEKFNSIDELKTYITSSQGSSSSYYSMAYSFGVSGAARSDLSSTKSVSPSSVSQESLDSSSSGGHSTTNNQIEGVDEADTIKNDGSYIYKITGSNVSIISAVPADGMKIVSSIHIDNSTPSNIFISSDRLAVFGTKYIYDIVPMVESKVASGVAIDSSYIMPPYYPSKQESFINVYDISDRSTPSLIANYTVDGNYYDSRMVGDYIYLLTSQYVYSGGDVQIPSAAYRCLGGGSCFNIWYFPGYDNGQQFTIVNSINIQNPAEPNSKVFLTGYSSNLFVSNDNIYVVRTKTLSFSDMLDRYVLKLSEVLPADSNEKISRIISTDLFSNDEKSSAIQRVIQNYTATLSGDALKNFFVRLEEKDSEFHNETAKEMERTVINKISISNGDIEYVATGEVPGTTLNQFSMDEYQGNLRIATTTDSWQTTSKNHLYVLDSQMNTIGMLEDMAAGERIYSVRFIGERAYLVTFRQTDPLFVIDLKIPTEPKMLGELKINGVSDYLHPYDATHLIGVGNDATDAGNLKGLKIALFDVSDPSNIIVISNITIGDRGTSSDALYDHKAFLFSKDNNLLAIPVSLVEGQKWDSYQGEYVFNIDLENGIALKGRISHDNRTDASDYMDYNSRISRALYIGDSLYTVSQSEIKANSINDLSEIGKIALPLETYSPYSYGYME